MNNATIAFRKLTTKPVWYWEKKRPYFLLSKLKQLPRLQSNLSQESPKINILCTPKTIPEALFSAWSWCMYLGDMFGIRIIIDGDFPSKFKNDIFQIIHGLEFTTVDNLISPSLFLKPSLHSFGSEHPLGRKLLMILSLQKQGEFIYSDNDVLVFNNPIDLLVACDTKRAVYNQESVGSAFDTHLIAFAANNRIYPAPSFNSGLVYFPKDSVDINLIDQLASIKNKTNYTWFDEQTMLALALGSIGAKPLNPTDYVVNTRRQFWWDNDVNYLSICTRHFTGPVRHVMYSHGYNRLLSLAKND